jgi:UDP-GlcNAc:undecaprenyl-phosphate/decaprenyl-phosphate GlcNAc-1-phosphate transferase
LKSLLGLIAALLGTGFAIVFLRKLAAPLGLIDRPGGRKQHDLPIPLVGGLAMFAALVGTVIALGMGISAGYFLLALAVIVVVGVLDDMNDLKLVPKFAGQVVACLIMILGAGVQLKTVGNLIGFGHIGLSLLSIPLSIFAVVGVINAVNMVDGMDGLAGSLSLIAVVAYAAVAALSGLEGQYSVLVILAGALVGYLYFNLRYSTQPRAAVFMGDAGSMLLGFVLAWFAIDLTQGPGRTFPPICALWVVLLPVADTVSLAARRLAKGKSPFAADREHIHHLLCVAGLSYGQTVLALLLVSVLFAAVGIAGWLWGVPEPVLFWVFFVLFFAYHFAVKAVWKKLAARDPQTVFSTY